MWESGCHEDSGEDDYVSAAEKTVYKDYLPHFLDRERMRTSIFLSARIWFFLSEVFCEGPIEAVHGALKRISRLVIASDRTCAREIP